MSADWFCKIGDKKIGPLNGQQLKTIVAKGQLKPEHLVRRGSEGPWVAAGRIKGLFPEGPVAGAAAQAKSLPPATAKPLPKAAKPVAPPTAKASALPSAAEAPTPPNADLPQEFTVGGHDKHHVEMNFDNFIDATPPPISHRKGKAGVKSKAGIKSKASAKGPKPSGLKNQPLLLGGIIGGGVIVLGLIAWVVVSSMTAKPIKPQESKEAAAVPAADSGKKIAKDSGETKKPAEKETAEKENWDKVPKASGGDTPVGSVRVKVLKPLRGPPAEGVKTEDAEVLIVPVNLELAEGAKKSVQLTSWMDDTLKNQVSLKDDQDNSYELLGQAVVGGGDGKAIVPDTKLHLRLFFKAPTDEKLKFLHLKLPSTAFQPAGPMIRYVINPNDIKPAAPDKAEKATKSDVGDAGEDASKGGKK